MIKDIVSLLEKLQAIQNAATAAQSAAITKLKQLSLIPDMRIEEIGLSSRISNLLRRHGIVTLHVLSIATEEELMDIRGFGMGSLEDVRKKLAEYGLELDLNRPLGRPNIHYLLNSLEMVNETRKTGF